MRTTLNIEEEALVYAKEKARVTGKSLGEVVSEAILESSKPKKVELAVSESGLPYIKGSGVKRVTSEMVQKALNDEDIEKHVSSGR